MTTHQNGKRVSVTQNGKTFSADTEPPANTVADRVYEIIDDLSGKAGKPVWFAQKELAEFLGVTPQTLSLAISELKADGLIGVTRTGKKFSKSLFTIFSGVALRRRAPPFAGWY